MQRAEPLDRPRGHPAATAPVPPARPLVVTADERLLDALLRLTAAAGVTPEVAHDAAAARAQWSAASLVVVADDALGRLGEVAPPRRPGVVVVTVAGPDSLVWRSALAIGAEQVLVLPDDEQALTGRLADTVDQRGAGSGLAVAVVGGCGGAGASTFAAALGVTAGRLGRRAMVLDADPLGGGLDLVLGSESVPGVRWPDLMGTSGRVSAPSLREALPRAAGVVSVLSWDRGDVAAVEPSVIRAVLAAGRRGHEVVVADVPRRLDPGGEEVLAQAEVTYLLVPAHVRAVAAAGRVARRLAGVAPRVELVVRGPGPSGLDGPLVADSIGLPLAAQMRPERGLDAAVDAGDGLWRRGRGPLARTCRTLLQARLGASGEW